MDYIAIHQGVSDIEIWQQSPRLSQAVVALAVQEVFPAGDDWSRLVNARSLKVIHLIGDIYLLSYTLVLGHEHGYRNGTLHAWGMIDTASAFYTKATVRDTVLPDLFRAKSVEFAADQLASAMIAGLTPKFAAYRATRSWPWWSWLGRQLGLRIMFPARFRDATEWTQVEDLVNRAFRSTLWKAGLAGKLGMEIRIPSFTTLTLSYAERTDILGIHR